MKKRGFGVGKWNGFGGKVQDGETIEAAAIRELYEEAGVRTALTDLHSVGSVKFYFNDKPEWNQQMHIYLIDEWEGEPQESEEMLPKWFAKTEIPYESMWVADCRWMSHVFDGQIIEAEVYFNQDGAELDKFVVKELITQDDGKL
jgi:8-oxo-dGTP diphosphatase